MCVFENRLGIRTEVPCTVTQLDRGVPALAGFGSTFIALCRVLSEVKSHHCLLDHCSNQE